MDMDEGFGDAPSLRPPADDTGPRYAPGDFTCAICERAVSTRWNGSGPRSIIPPLCLYCEGDYSRGRGKAVAGSYRDRRFVAQGHALAEALRCEAARQHWPLAWRILRET